MFHFLPAFIYTQCRAAERKVLNMSLPEVSVPVDLCRVQTAADGDHDFERELFELYLSDAQMRVEHVGRLADGQDPPALQREAHTLKGASANIGANEMARLALVLEKAAPEAEPSQIATLAQEIQEELNRVRAYLLNYLAGLH